MPPICCDNKSAIFLSISSVSIDSLSDNQKLPIITPRASIIVNIVSTKLLCLALELTAVIIAPNTEEIVNGNNGKNKLPKINTK